MPSFPHIVSILVLLDDRLKAPEKVKTVTIEWVFQSLFYWMIVLKPGFEKGYSESMMFQSLFYWMIVLKNAPMQLGYWVAIVSILVLLDDRLKVS